MINFMYFNSIKVRLEQSLQVLVFLVLSYFNSIKVRLEPSGSGEGMQFRDSFQFHKGAIRTYKKAVEKLRDK